jgi:CheY-like chemotaxis protein
MTTASATASSLTLSDRIAPHLPLLRRYARALTGSQSSGDAHVVALLEALIADRTLFGDPADARVGLYAAFHRMWESATVDAPQEPLRGREAVAQERLGKLTPRCRQALLLTAVEGFAHDDAGAIMGVAAGDVDALLEEAAAELRRQTLARVLIIEDEPIIAMDIEAVVQDLGHTVVGIADTRDRAVAMAKAERPDIVLADIQLADGSSGIDAVRDILGEFATPVIFITAYPERLLTGVRPEPTYLITKPFQPRTVEAAMGQALFFREEAQLV